MKKNVIFTVLLLGMIILTQSAQAIGVLFSRPVWSNQTYNKMWIKTVDATVEINGQVAVTYVDQIFKNEMNNTVEAVWVFPLPEGAVVTELYYWFNGQRYKGSIRERQEAQQQYQDKIRQMLDPALLEYLGDNLYRLSIAPINAQTDVRTEITYVQLLPYEFGTIDYTFLLNAVELTPKPLNRISVNTTVETPSQIKHLYSPSHQNSTATSINQINDNKYTVTFGDENFLPEKDLKISFETIREQVDVNVLSYTPSKGDSIGTDSYYAVWITPPDSIGDDKVIPRKIVFTADVSSSMEGLRIEQLKTSLLAFLDCLNPQDMFNILTFGTTVVPYQPDLVPATAEHVENAKTFVKNIGALGLTNINQAMLQSLQQSFSDECANMIVFITDGYPTWDVTFIPDILENINQANMLNTRIYPFGVGDDVSKQLLGQMALENGGYATYIQQDENIAKMVSNHFTRISKPILTDLDIKIAGLETWDKYPRLLSDLFWGSQVMQLGLYSNSGNFPVYLTGRIGKQDIGYHSQANFLNIPGEGHRFIPRLWAQSKINHLLNEIAIYGEQVELVNQVIELSLKYQILTPYTAFYADPDDNNTAVDNNEDKIPQVLSLHQNYPNPFNPTTTIAYELYSPGQVTIKIYDITGRLVKILLYAQLNAGLHNVVWDATDFKGNPVAAGIYIYKIEFTGIDNQKFTQCKKMSFVK